MKWAKVSYRKSEGEVRFEVGKVSPDKMMEAIRTTGFGAALIAVKGLAASTGEPRKDCGLFNAFC